MCNKTLITPPESKNKVNRERYGSLDGLRAYAALGIILMHVLANINVKPSENYLTESIIPFFTDFTLLFMVVSGFSLCCGYYTRIKEGTITPNAFYRKRYLRILPFFALLCLIDLALEPNIGSLYEAFANMTLCFGLLPPDAEIHVIGVGWFLGVVFLFYMLFPFYVFMLDNSGARGFHLPSRWCSSLCHSCISAHLDGVAWCSALRCSLPEVLPSFTVTASRTSAGGTHGCRQLVWPLFQ